jgi:hypothetical protein
MLGWASLLAAGIVLVGVGLFVAATRLDDADRWGSVIGALAALLGLPMTAYGLMLARRQSKASTWGQAVTDSVVGGGVTQVRGVRGNVRIGASPPGPPPILSSPAVAPSAPCSVGDQWVHRTWTAGPVRQVDDIGGDADIDR